MKKALIFALFGLVSLFWVGLVSGLQVFESWDSLMVDKPRIHSPIQREMSWQTYNKIKMALGSFDLVNGLTKHDLETMHTDNSLGFYYLIACLWLVLGLRLVKRPLKS